MNITTLGIDLAKDIFQLHGVDRAGKLVLKKKLNRSKLLEFIAKLPVCRIVVEACGGANYWARKFSEHGHQVQVISPPFVKPFVKGNKHDEGDAEAIVEAASRPALGITQDGRTTSYAEFVKDERRLYSNANQDGESNSGTISGIRNRMR